MASSTNALSYLDPSAYQSIAPSSTTSASASTAAGGGSGPGTGVSATDGNQGDGEPGRFPGLSQQFRGAGAATASSSKG